MWKSEYFYGICDAFQRSRMFKSTNKQWNWCKKPFWTWNNCLWMHKSSRIPWKMMWTFCLNWMNINTNFSDTFSAERVLWVTQITFEDELFCAKWNSLINVECISVWTGDVSIVKAWVHGTFEEKTLWAEFDWFEFILIRLFSRNGVNISSHRLQQSINKCKYFF